MKTSEFIKKFNDLSFYLRAIDHDGEVWIMWKDCKVYGLSEDTIYSCANEYGLTVDKLALIVEYLNTPIDEREPERKWVVPFEKYGDGTCRYWYKVVSNGTTEYMLGNKESIKYYFRNYDFTDSELDDLKQSQPAPIAKAIDEMKKPAPKEADD